MRALELISMTDLCFEDEQLPEVMRSFTDLRAEFMEKYKDGDNEFGISDYINSFRRFVNHFNENSKQYYINSTKSMIIDYYYDDIEDEITFNDLANQEDINEEDAQRLAEKCMELRNEGVNDAIFVLHRCEINERRPLGIIKLK